MVQSVKPKTITPKPLIVIIRFPIEGEDSDMKSDGEEIVDATDMPNDIIAGEMEAFQGTSKEVMSDFDPVVQGSSEPTAKKVKKLAWRSDNLKWVKRHIQPKPTYLWTRIEYPKHC